MDNHDENNQSEQKLSLKETIIGWLWLIYLGGFFIKTTYGYFFDPLLKSKGLAYNIGLGLFWFTVFPVFKGLLALIIIGALVFWSYADKK